MELPPQRRRLRVARARKRFRNPLLAELLIEKSRERVFADPKESAELARLGFEVAIRQRIILPSGVDLSLEPMTRALAYEANGLRASGDPKAAEQPMSRALTTLPKLAPTVRAEVLDLAASLRRDQRRFHEALTFIDFAIQLYEKAGDPHMVGEKLVVKAQILNYMGSAEEAIDTIKAALDRLDERRDLRRYLAAEHALTCYLLDAGHPATARQRFDEAQRLYERFESEPMIQLRRRWLEGKIARKAASGKAAKRPLIEALAEYLRQARRDRTLRFEPPT